jgi:hypothetical protein
MTAREVVFTQDGEYSAQEMRLMMAAMFGGRWPTDLSPAGPLVSAGGGHGVVGAGDLLVVENGTPNMSVTIAAGVAVVRGTDQGDQGVYVVANDAPVNVPITTADATNPRIDLVVAEVEDTEYGGGTSQLNLRVIAGTPASVPSAPTVPDSTLVLASVSVPASDTAITDSQITDLRTRAYATGATAVCKSSATYPSPAAEGQQVYDLSLHQFLIYNGTIWAPPNEGGLLGAGEGTGSYVISYDADSGLNLVSSASATFVAPASGSVLVRIESLMRTTGGSYIGGAQVFWGVMENDGGWAQVGNALPIAEVPISDTSLYGRYTASFPVTGLTPGAEFTYRWGGYVTVSATCSAETNGRHRIEVWAA